MSAQAYDRIDDNPKFHALVASRRRFAWTLSIVMLGIYYAFIMVIAFAPEVLAVPIAAGSVVTIGLPIGVAIIVSAIALTGVYVHRANGEFDRKTAEILKEAA